MVPFAFTGVSIAHPRLFEGSPDGAFSLNLVWSQAIEAGRAYGMRMDGVWMHVGTPEALAQAERCLSGASRLKAGPRGWRWPGRASTRLRPAAVPDGGCAGAAGRHLPAPGGSA